MDNKQLTADEVAALIRSRQLLKQTGLPLDADIKTICQHAGISRKTGYQWIKKVPNAPGAQETQLRYEIDQLKAEHEDLKKRFDDVCFENKGRKLAWEIHDVDKMLAKKKSTMGKSKKKKR